jgi:preprotein translocase subunit SecE
MKKPKQKKKKKATRKKSHAAPGPKAPAFEEGKESLPEKKEVAPAPPPQVPRREPERKKEEGKSPLRYFGVAAQFLRESKMELKKVKWPTRKELLASTVMVLFLVLVVAFFLGVVDFGLIKIIRHIVG